MQPWPTATVTATVPERSGASDVLRLRSDIECARSPSGYRNRDRPEELDDFADVDCQKTRSGGGPQDQIAVRIALRVGQRCVVRPRSIWRSDLPVDQDRLCEHR